MKKTNLVFYLFSVLIVSFLFYSFTGTDSRWIKTVLYFGLSVPGGGVVSDEQFRAFTNSVITTAFPEGFTVVNSAGGWYDPK